jgi:hypothetical protein
MDRQRTHDLQASYTRVAAEYTRRIADELAHKPLDRQLLDRLAERVRGLGPVCDMGCGPATSPATCTSMGWRPAASISPPAW